MDNQGIKAGLTTTDGKSDLTLEASLSFLKTIPSQSAIGTNSAISKIGGKWYQVAVQTNPLLPTQCPLPRNVNLSRNEGPLSKILNKLSTSTLFRMDVIKDAQMILNMSTPLRVFSSSATNSGFPRHAFPVLSSFGTWGTCWADNGLLKSMFLKNVPGVCELRQPQASMVGPVFVVPNIGHDVQDALGHF